MGWTKWTMKSIEHIKFKNDYAREEFIITVVRPEIPEEDVYHGHWNDHDKPKSKNQKYLTTEYGKKFIQNRSKNSQT